MCKLRIYSRSISVVSFNSIRLWPWYMTLWYIFLDFIHGLIFIEARLFGNRFCFRLQARKAPKVSTTLGAFLARRRKQSQFPNRHASIKIRRWTNSQKKQIMWLYNVVYKGLHIIPLEFWSPVLITSTIKWLKFVHNLFVCLVLFLKQTLIISLNSIHGLVCLMQEHSFLCDV